MRTFGNLLAALLAVVASLGASSALAAVQLNKLRAPPGFHVDLLTSEVPNARQMALGRRADGKAVLMVSSELPEVIGMSDRILVMRDGRLAGELPPTSSEEDVLALATGVRAGQQVAS